MAIPAAPRSKAQRTTLLDLAEQLSDLDPPGGTTKQYFSLSAHPRLNLWPEIVAKTGPGGHHEFGNVYFFAMKLSPSFLLLQREYQRPAFDRRCRK
jgi:hypothetical protein